MEWNQTEIHIHDLPNLEELIIEDILNQKIELDNLPSLRRLILASQAVEFKEGISNPIQITINEEVQIHLSNFEHNPDFSNKLGTLTLRGNQYIGNHQFIENINLKIKNTEDLELLKNPENKWTFQIIKIANFQNTNIELSLPEIQVVSFKQVGTLTLPLYFNFNSPNLIRVDLPLQTASLSLYFSRPLQSLNLFCHKAHFLPSQRIKTGIIGAQQIIASDPQSSFYNFSKLNLINRFWMKPKFILAQNTDFQIEQLKMIQPYSQFLLEFINRCPKLTELVLIGDQRGDIEFVCPRQLKMLDIHSLRSTYEFNKKTDNYKFKAIIQNPRTEIIELAESNRYELREA